MPAKELKKGTALRQTIWAAAGLFLWLLPLTVPATWVPEPNDKMLDSEINAFIASAYVTLGYHGDESSIVIPHSGRKVMYEETASLARITGDQRLLREPCYGALFVRRQFGDHNQKMAEVCDIENVSQSCRQWQVQLRVGQVSVTPPKESKVPALTTQELADWSAFLAATSADVGVSVYPGAKPVEPDGTLFGPEEVRRVLADFRGFKAEALKGKGFMLLTTADPPKKVLNFYRNALKDRKPEVVPHPDGGFGLQTTDRAEKDSNRLPPSLLFTPDRLT